MKTKLFRLLSVSICVHLWLSICPSRAQTNADPYPSWPGITNIWLGTNYNDSTRDAAYVAWEKADHNFLWLNSATASNSASIVGITTQLHTNQILSSQQLIAYSNTNIVWGTSNYLTRSANGVYSWFLQGGQLGGSGLTAGTNVFIQLCGSYTGTNAWFVLTNGFTTTNAISLSTSGAGGGLGNCTVYYLDHPELLGKTNGFFGQIMQFPAPKNPSDAATKGYVDIAIANVSNGNWIGNLDSNATWHFTYSWNNFEIADLASYLTYIPITNLFVDGTATNVALQIMQTNLTNGFTIQSSTNLSITAGFTLFTNYTLSTNTGVVTFTIPINFNEGQRFWRAVSGSSASVTFFTPVTMPYANLVSNTITHSTNSTLGYGAGLITCDTNYIYVSVATNTWRRVAIPTNTW